MLTAHPTRTPRIRGFTLLVLLVVVAILAILGGALIASVCDLRLGAQGARIGVPVARTRLLCSDDSVIGQMFYLMDAVEGRILVNPAMPDQTPAERAAIFDSIACFTLSGGRGGLAKPSCRTSTP